MIKEIIGDLIEMAENGKVDVVVNPSNCQGVMGKGFSLQVKEKFFENKLIDFNGQLPGTIKGIFYENGLTVINAYTQIFYNTFVPKKSIHPNHNNLGDTTEDRYNYIRLCLKQIKKHFGDKIIGLPKIGCGLAGGNWEIVKKIIEKELDGCTVIIVTWNK